MNYKEKVVKAFQELFGVENQKFEDVKGTDSRIFRVSGVAKDETIMEVTEAGVVPVDNGDVTLEDGTVITVADNVMTNVVEGEAPDAGADVTEEMSKLKLFSKSERANFTIIKEISVWETEVNNTSFELGEKVTYTYEEVEYGVCDGQYELEDGTKIFIDSESVIVMRILPDGTVEAPTSAEPSEEAAPADEQMKKEENFDKQMFENIEKLISEFSSLKNENKELKEKVDKLGALPSDAPTSTKVDFSKDKSEDSKIDSPLHRMLESRK